MTARGPDALDQPMLELRALQLVAEAVSRSLDLDLVLGRCLELVMEVAHSPMGAIYLREEKRGIYRRMAARNLADEVAPATLDLRPVEEFDSFEHAHFNDLEHLPADHPLVDACRRHGIIRSVTVPLLLDARLVGVLYLNYHHPLEITASTLATFEAIAHYETIAIERARAHRQVEEQGRLALVLREFGERALLAEGQELPKLVLSYALRLTSSDCGLITEAVGDRLRVVATVGNDEMLGLELPLDTPYLGDSLQQTAPLVIEDTSLLSAESPLGARLREHRTASLLVCAMWHGGQPLGRLLTGSSAPRRYETEQIEALGLLSSMAAAALARERLRAAARARKEQLDAIIEHLPIVITVLDREGRPVLLNAAGRAFAKAQHLDLQASSPDLARLRFLEPDGQPLAPEHSLLTQALAGLTPAPRELLMCVDELRMNVLGLAAPIPDEQGRIQEVVTAWQDISEIRELAAAKDRFISIASHELRAPIAGIRATTTLLEIDPRADSDPARRQGLLERIQRQVDRLSRVVDQLLDSAKLGASEVPLDLGELDLVNAAREAVELATSTEAHHRVILDQTGPVLGRWDQARIEQLLTNLVGNAIRYSPAGAEIRVRVRGEPGCATVAVIDEGIGIPQHELAGLFQPFSRASNAAGHSRAGLGLGLHIAAEIARRHGGQLRVESELGAGSTFTLELPR